MRDGLSIWELIPSEEAFISLLLCRRIQIECFPETLLCPGLVPHFYTAGNLFHSLVLKEFTLQISLTRHPPSAPLMGLESPNSWLCLIIAADADVHLDRTRDFQWPFLQPLLLRWAASSLSLAPVFWECWQGALGWCRGPRRLMALPFPHPH